jgi:DNA-binding NarL/FixJ family response regulator
MTKTKIIIVEDNVLFFEGLKKIINDIPELIVVQEVKNAHETIKLIEENKMFADVLIVNLNKPELNGIEITKYVNAKGIRIKVLGLLFIENPFLLNEFIFAGGNGHLIKNSNAQTLHDAIKAIKLGTNYFDPIKYINNKSHLASKNKINSAIKLSKREMEILTQIARGFSNKEIGTKLFISHKTVDNHRTSLMKKLEANKSTELVRHAISLNLI